MDLNFFKKQFNNNYYKQYHNISIKPWEHANLYGWKNSQPIFKNNKLDKYFISFKAKEKENKTKTKNNNSNKSLNKSLLNKKIYLIIWVDENTAKGINIDCSIIYNILNDLNYNVSYLELPLSYLKDFKRTFSFVLPKYV